MPCRHLLLVSRVLGLGSWVQEGVWADEGADVFCVEAWRHVEDLCVGRQWEYSDSELLRTTLNTIYRTFACTKELRCSQFWNAEFSLSNSDWAHLNMACRDLHCLTRSSTM